MTTEFTALNLRPELVQAVSERGYTAPTAIQAALIPVMLTGVDVIGQAQTGTGKTAAFALPILHHLQPGQQTPQALVMAPTRELAMQVAEAVYQYGRFCNVRVLAIYGGSSYARQLTRLKKGVDVVVGTPGRLLDLVKQGALDLGQVRTVVLDEADEMLSMGFVEDIQAILAATPADRQTALFTATLPKEIRQLASAYMRAPESISVRREQMTVAAIDQRHYLVTRADKFPALMRLFEMETVTRGLIFARTRAGAAELTNQLAVNGIPAETLSGELSQEARERTLVRFREGRVRVLVATDVAARGLDVEDISHVFNYELPDDPEVYVHRIGRTGRAGKAGVAISLVAGYDRPRLKRLEAFIKRPIVRATLPSPDEVLARREALLVERIGAGLQADDLVRERALVERLTAAGHDPLTVAAAALRLLRQGEQDPRPLATVRETAEERPARRYERDTRHSDDLAGSHEIGMVRLLMSKGRQHGLRPADVVGMIAHHAEIPGKTIGKILIRDQHTLVDVPEQFVPQVLSGSGTYRINRQPIQVQVA